MGFVKKINKSLGGVIGSGLPMLGIDNPFAVNEEVSGEGVEKLEETAEELKKKKAATFTSGGLLGEEVQAGSGTTFGN